MDVPSMSMSEDLAAWLSWDETASSDWPDAELVVTPLITFVAHDKQEAKTNTPYKYYLLDRSFEGRYEHDAGLIAYFTKPTPSPPQPPTPELPALSPMLELAPDEAPAAEALEDTDDEEPIAKRTRRSRKQGVDVSEHIVY
ncbi:hypothetical protein FDECE_12936 [Fusarium decemcellulare]|nr:hypothetical protein FDECE_12936 [Fusarium decemcellulare]